MTEHRRIIHGKEMVIDWNRLLVSQTEDLPQVYDVSFPKGTTQCPYPFPICPRSSRTYNGIWNHFNWKHWGDNIRIMEEHPPPFTKCDHFRSQVPPWSLNNSHYESQNCWIGEARQSCKENLQNCFEASWVSIKVNAETIDHVNAFP